VKGKEKKAQSRTAANLNMPESKKRRRWRRRGIRVAEVLSATLPSHACTLEDANCESPSYPIPLLSRASPRIIRRAKPMMVLES
jgi:hypothetical protein